LLNRTTRSVSLTQAGERFLARLQPVLDDVNAALESVSSFRDRPTGTLRLTVAPPAVKMVIEPVLARFLAAYPDVSVEVSSDGALVNIITERYDAGVRLGERVEKDMISLRLTKRARPVVVASPAYIKKRGRPDKPDDLQSHNCIRARFPSGALLEWQFARGAKPYGIAVQGNVIANTQELILQAALDGIGLAHLMEDDVMPHVKAKRLILLLEEWALPGPDFALYYPSRRYTPLVLQAFIDFLRKDGLLVGGRRPNN
jgi:DNA-binding transcriptional LysR family regulator